MSLAPNQSGSGRCSVRSADAHEPLAGTAPVVRSWVVLEQRGPYGPKALTDSHLEDHIGQALAAASAPTGTTVVLARRPGHAADERRGDEPRRVWIAHVPPGRVTMRTAVIGDPRELLEWDFAAIAAGDLPAIGQPDATPTLFICTNGRRDLCCALGGRALVDGLAAGDADVADRVWETSHIGGHRFSPTSLLLPWGIVHGRLDVDLAAAVLRNADAGRHTATGCRGRSALPRWAQVAEIAVHDLHPGLGPDDLDTRCDEPLPDPAAAPVVAEVRHRDGRTWQIRVTCSTMTESLPASCGAEPETPVVYTAQTPTAAPDWR